jgi:hypothetical protein
MSIEYGWIIKLIDGYKHIMPTGETHLADYCFCHPELDDDLIIHNSFDHREEFEDKKRRVS